jgi:uncharacterized protein (DUF2267 family)
MVVLEALPLGVAVSEGRIASVSCGPRKIGTATQGYARERNMTSYDHFPAQVRDRGGYASLEHAEQVLAAALEVLATNLSPRTAQALAAQLPTFLTGALESRLEEEAEPFGAEEFCRRLAERTGAGPKTARWDAEAVLSSFADALPPGQIGDPERTAPWLPTFVRQTGAELTWHSRSVTSPRSGVLSGQTVDVVGSSACGVQGDVEHDPLARNQRAVSITLNR